MSPPTRYVLLVGSPKGKGGTSLQLGRYLMDHLPMEGTEKRTHHLGRALVRDDRWAEVMADVDAADTVVLSFPLYWDALPSHVTRSLEMMAERRTASPPDRPQTLVAIVNNGFPEPWHSQAAIRVCRAFAGEARFTWGGGVIVGGGSAINGRPVDEAGGMAIRLREALEKMALAITRGQPLTPEQEDAMALQLYPVWFAGTMGNLGWRRQARREGMVGSIKDRPYG